MNPWDEAKVFLAMVKTANQGLGKFKIPSASGCRCRRVVCPLCTYPLGMKDSKREVIINNGVESSGLGLLSKSENRRFRITLQGSHNYYRAVLSVHPPTLCVHPFPEVDYSVPARGVSTYNSC
jgi:hypothetical protein